MTSSLSEEMTGISSMPITTPAASADSAEIVQAQRLARVADEGRDRQGREEAEHDGGDAGQHFEDRLEDRPHGGRGIFGHVDRGEAGRSGPATHMAMTVMSKVPVSSGMKPKTGGDPVGAHCVPGEEASGGTSLKKRAVSNSTEKTMPMVVRMAIAEQTTRKPSVIRSNRLRARNSGEILVNNA